MIAEETLLQTTAFAAFALSLLFYLVAQLTTRSHAFKSFFVSPQVFHKATHWIGFAWAGGLAFHFAEFATAAVLNRTLIAGSVVAGKTALPWFGLFVASSFVFLAARGAFARHYAREVQRGPQLENARGGFLGLAVNDVEILRSVKEFKGDIRKIIFETGWLEEEEVLASLKKLWALKLVKVKHGRVYVTPEGNDVLIYPLALFSAGVDKRTLQEMSEAREALAKGDNLQVLAACSRVLERTIKECLVAPAFSEAEADKLFGKPLSRATLGDLIGFVRDRRKDHFLGGILTTINEARKSIHDGVQARGDEAACVYLLTELAVKYINSRNAAA
ncbi:MAG: hypothetical protein ACP5O3_02085 [Candidatus Micrarchaeia archaeon]|jgi:hypothetical protein